jgi:hypothetical protein
MITWMDIYWSFSLSFSTDKPSQPQGPLEIGDITPETCSLSWKPPLDDGGSPITNYVVEKLDPSSGVSHSDKKASQKRRNPA